MMNPPSIDSISGAVEFFLEGFEAAWEADLLPSIEEFLPPEDHPAHRKILVELACIDLERQWRRGARPDLSAYFTRFPALKADTEGRGQLAFEDYRQRLQRGDAPAPAEYQVRFGIETEDWPESADLSRRPIADDRQDFPQARSAADPARVPSGDAHPIGRTDPTRLVKPRPLTGVAPPRSFHSHLAGRVERAKGHMPKVGDTFLGFQLIHHLGSGAFGSVFLSNQNELAGRLVALKVSANLGDESQRLAQMQHTNIMPIYSAHTAGELHALCMPYFGGFTVADLCQSLSRDAGLPTSGRHIISTMQDRQRSLPTQSDLRTSPSQPTRRSGPAAPAVADGDAAVAVPALPGRDGLADAVSEVGFESMTYVDAVLWMASRLADGLAHAHVRGIIHRDLKPANILLADNGQPMLLDFNLAEDVKLRNTAAAAQIGGTLPYMSPEHLQAFAKRPGPTLLDGRSDVYSLGLILYQLLTGRHAFPHQGGTLDEIITKLLQDRSAPLPELRPFNQAVTPAVESIVRHCMAFDRDRRYPSARALKEDIDRQLADLPLRHAPEPSWRERGRKWARRHPRLVSPLSLATAALAALFLCGTLAAGAYRHQLDARRETAVARFAAFQREFREAELLLSNDDGEQLRLGVRAGQDVLIPYGVLEDPDWKQRRLVADLPPADRTRLTRQVGELAFLLARAAFLQDGDGANGQAEARLFHDVAGAHLEPEAAAVLALQRADLAGGVASAVKRQLRDRLHAAEARTGQTGFLLACDYTSRGEYREALDILIALVREAPEEFGNWFLKGRCHEVLGEPADALASYSVCIALRPDFARPYMARAAVCYDNRRQLPQALADLDEALRLDPKQYRARMDRSLVLGVLGRDREALSELDKVLENRLAPTRVYFMRATVRARLGDAEGAKKDKARGMKTPPNDADSWIVRGVERVPTDPAGALADFVEGEKRNPRSIHALKNQAYILGEVQKKHPEALAVLDRLVDRHPGFVEGRASRGVLLARLGRTKEAVKEAEECVKLSSQPEIRYRAACIYALAAHGDPKLLRESRRLLASALIGGWGYQWVSIDDDLDALRKEAGFEGLLGTVRLLQAWQNQAKK